MPSIASSSSHAISGFSGLPKLRQSVSASGSPPAQATFRAASSTASIPAERGSSRAAGPGPSSETASPRMLGRRRSTAASSPGRRALADRRVVELPAVEHALRRLQHLRPDDRDHALLALGDHDLPGLEVGLAERHAVEPDVDPRVVPRHLGERGREAGGAAVLERLDEPALDELDRGLDELLARERIAVLDRGPLLVGALPELLAREHAGAADPVAAGGGAEEQDELPRPVRPGALHALAREQPDAHRIDEAVVGVGRVEDALAADCRDTDAVAVVADPRDGAVEGEAGLAEAQAVEERDRPRAHRDDVAEDPADSRRRALERLDRRGGVVALDPERDRLAVAEVDHARVLARPLEDALAARGH